MISPLFTGANGSSGTSRKWATISSLAGSVGHDPQDLARLQCEARNRLVDPVLSRGQYAPPHGTDLRRLSFRELRRDHQESDGMECRLRKVSWARQRPREAALTDKYS